MEEGKYVNSKETKSILRIKDCDLMHIRTAGKLKFVKNGNAFMYSKDSVEEFKERNIKSNRQNNK